jgi:hypothetical protein
VLAQLDAVESHWRECDDRLAKVEDTSVAAPYQIKVRTQLLEVLSIRASLERVLAAVRTTVVAVDAQEGQGKRISNFPKSAANDN